MESVFWDAVFVVGRIVERRRDNGIEPYSKCDACYLNVFSMRLGMILLSTGQVISRQGLVLISMSQGL